MTATSGEALQLVCLPHSGGSVRPFHQWRPALAPEIVVRPLDFRRCAARTGAPPASTLSGAAAALLPSVANCPRYALFGCSMGGLLGYELARLACASDAAPPEFLVLAGCRPPHRRSAAIAALASLCDDELLDRVTELGTVPSGLRGSPMQELFLPVLRADLELVAGYSPDPDAGPLPVDLLVWYGTDDPTTPEDVLHEWTSYTSGACELTAFPGTHFFPHEHPNQVTRLVRRRAGSACGSGQPN
jgi:medium-chain acyl-[acyl-carrier-protein] hydrolase